MSEYLDKTGLSYFWGKVKEKLNNKADESDVTNVVTNVKEQLEEELKYKANRNQLNGKADIDQYKIINISTKKFKFDTIKSQDSYLGYLNLIQPEQNNFMQTFPSGYTIKCILAVEFAYFETEEKYNNNNAIDVRTGYSILPISISAEGQTSSTSQRWSVVDRGTMNMYGAIIFYTLLLEKPQLPVG